jgi:hypothetical protein
MNFLKTTAKEGEMKKLDNTLSTDVNLTTLPENSLMIYKDGQWVSIDGVIDQVNTNRWRSLVALGLAIGAALLHLL